MQLCKIWRPVLATVALYAAVMAVYVAKYQGDVSSLCCLGCNRAGLAPYEAVTLSIGPNGYDGQFYYVIARAPWRSHENEAIDGPAARSLRILYPALCWLLSGGDGRLLFWVMPAVNLAALAGLAGLGAWMAIRCGMSPWWGAVLPVAVNAGMPALHNLTDPLSTLAVFGLLSAWLVRAPWWMLSLCSAAAVFSREQNVAVAIVIVLAAIGMRRPSVAAGIAAVLLLWLGWVCFLRATYGVWPFLPAQGNLGKPLAGIIYRWTHLGGNDAFSRRLAIIFGLSMVHLAVEIALGAYMATRPGSLTLKVCMLLGLTLALLGGTYIYGDFWSYTRVFVWLPLGIWLGGLQARQRWPLLLLSPAALWTLAAAAKYV